MRHHRLFVRSGYVGLQCQSGRGERPAGRAELLAKRGSIGQMQIIETSQVQSQEIGTQPSRAKSRGREARAPLHADGDAVLRLPGGAPHEVCGTRSGGARTLSGPLPPPLRGGIATNNFCRINFFLQILYRILKILNQCLTI